MALRAGPMPNTVDAFKWAFHDTALWAAQHYSPAGGVHAVVTVLEELNIMTMPLGPGVKFRNTVDLTRFPIGTLVTQGDVNNIGTYNVWVVRTGQRHHVLGQGRTTDRRFTIAEMPGFPESPAWLSVKASAEQASLLAEWKKRAWEVAFRAKLRHGWCGDFETVMFSMDVRGN